MSDKRRPFKAIFSTFDGMKVVIDTAHRNGVLTLVIRNPRDGGPASWHSEKCRSLTTDLTSDEGVLATMKLISESIPDAVIFTTPPDRNITRLQAEGGEVQVIQELLWRHAGLSQTIEAYYPSSQTMMGGGQCA